MQGLRNTGKWVAHELKGRFHALWFPGLRVGCGYTTELTGGTKRLLAQNRAEPPLHSIISQSVVHTFLSFASLGSIKSLTVNAPLIRTISHMSHPSNNLACVDWRFHIAIQTSGFLTLDRKANLLKRKTCGNSSQMKKQS